MLSAIDLLGDDNGLAGDVEALAAAHVFAGHYVVFADHVVAGLGESGAVAFVGAAGELALLGADQPGHFVLRGLVAVGTIQVRRLFFLAFVEKFAFFHRIGFWLAGFPARGTLSDLHSTLSPTRIIAHLHESTDS